MSNRVEDLERQVTELQAAVNGLTEELVETKERVRQLEADRTAPATTAERQTASDAHAEVVERQPDADETPAEDADEPPVEDAATAHPASDDAQVTDGDGVIVAGVDGVGPESASADGDGSNGRTDAGDDDRGSESDTSSSDIIVA
jgi:TolA-binding protein